MRQLALVWPVFISMLVNILPVIAADADEATMVAPTILQQGGNMTGYTPLTVESQQFPAVLLKQTLGESRGAIVLMHDVGEKLDSPLISTLRKQLPAHGWDTLSIELNQNQLQTASLSSVVNAVPAETVDEKAEATETQTVENTENAIESSTPEPADAAPVAVVALNNAQRIDAALAFLQAQGHEKIILLGHGKAGELALKVAQATSLPVTAVVLMGTAQIDESISLTQLNRPILEVYGTKHEPLTIHAIEQRQVAMKMQDSSLYAVRKVEAANRQFTGMQTTLASRIHGWLFKYVIEGSTQ